MAIDPCLHSFSPQRVELLEEPAISVEFARGPELAHNVVSANGVNEYAPCIAPAQFSVVDQFCQEATARISRISEELKLISLTLLMISRPRFPQSMERLDLPPMTRVVGTSSRPPHRGTVCTDRGNPRHRAPLRCWSNLQGCRTSL
jgi:hypothetical protein